ncbi:leucine-rich repeat and calponin homology domain-containing protein 4, partial [Ornithorhynchus anatinus]|uniref:leucine-rich repeat and calponin homology domain-containing protein 4 n=1 Tax=Ornithorhynchus anatinus TaxID=9258 RepID=UPI0010A856BC
AAEEAAAPGTVPPPSGPPGLPGHRSAERALEEAVSTGRLNLSNRRLKQFPRAAARAFDLSDITHADLSRNRFPEVPEAVCQLVSLEGLSLYHNCLRGLNPGLGNLTALTYLNLSRNQLSSLPPYVCRLPLRVLIVSNNKLGALPSELGALAGLRQLDVSSNELKSLPPQLSGLEALRDLNVRRNHLSALPDELGDLPLVRLDFSCNRVVRIPASFCRLRHLQAILLDSNPLQSPPAQICLKGKFHIFKYLCAQARGGRGDPGLGELEPAPPSSGFSPCPAEEPFPGRPSGGLDSGFHSVDSGSKRWSGNESTDEFSELSFRISELARERRGPPERRENGAGDGHSERVDYIDSNEEEEEEEECRSPPKVRPGARESEGPGSSSRREDPAGEERRRPDTLQLWQERERKQREQQQQGTQRGPLKRDSFRKATSGASGASTSTPATHNGPTEGSNPQPGISVVLPSPEPLPSPGPASVPYSRPPGSIQRPNSFLFRSSSQSCIQPGSPGTLPPSPTSPDSCFLLPSSSGLRPRRPLPTLDERETASQLRQVLESRLQLSVPEDLGEALADGVLLCQLANKLRPRVVPTIHVPSPAVPKLSAVNCRTNVESFLEACRKMGVPKAELCPASDLLQGSPRGLRTALDVSRRALGAGDPGPAPPGPAPANLAGFALFYVAVMLVLYVAYARLVGP